MYQFQFSNTSQHKGPHTHRASRRQDNQFRAEIGGCPQEPVSGFIPFLFCPFEKLNLSHPGRFIEHLKEEWMFYA